MPRNISKSLYTSQIIILVVLTIFLLGTNGREYENSITITDTWVEDGFLFHVELEAPPSNVGCSFDGEGLIEFEVVYTSQTYSQVASVFSVATWYPSSQSHEPIETQGKAIGPQGLCTTFSPCRIYEVKIVKAWCPVSDGPMYTW